MDTLAEVIINRPSKHLNRTFTYRIPEELSFLCEGWRCIVPFSGRTEEAIILSTREEDISRLTYSVKDIQGAVDTFRYFTPEMLKTAWWISSYYLCTLIDALRLFLIDKKGIKTKVYYSLCWDKIPKDHPLRGLIDESVEMLTEEDCLLLFTDSEFAKTLSNGYIARRESVKASHREPLERWIAPTLPIPEEETARKKKQVLLYAFLTEHGSVPVKEGKKQGFSMEVMRSLVQGGHARFFYKKKDTYSLIGDSGQLAYKELTEEQKKACEQIIQAEKEKKFQGILLKGVTGSGKTEVYVRAADQALAMGGMALILVPEIALTVQMVSYFAHHFGDDVVFIHSQLSKGERYNNRMRVERGESHVIIGSRSALFMPFRNLRLIVVDEEYDSSYKQDETPRYNGCDLAKVMAVTYQCPIVLGAATPSVNTYYAAKTNRISLITMNKRVFETPLPEVSIVDMKQPQALVQSPLFCDALLHLLKKTVNGGKKAIVFLNRRGYATTLMCTHCGYVFKCPHCEVSLVYHKDRQRLQCHYCESSYPLPQECPKCHSQKILYSGSGTQKLVENLCTLVPQACIARLDLDSTRNKNSARDILDDFRNGKYNILVGTQMVAKGHDIPGVQAVGVVGIDMILNLPTYLASEHAFTLITQCAGRSGRDREQGHVILQTYTPENFVIQAAARQDYESFYTQEIQFRKLLGYPPFMKLLKISCFGKEYRAVSEKAARVYAWLRRETRQADSLQITPPYDEAIKKKRDTYYISILIKGEDLAPLKQKIRQSFILQENGIIIDVDPL